MGFPPVDEHTARVRGDLQALLRINSRPGAAKATKVLPDQEHPLLRQILERKKHFDEMRARARTQARRRAEKRHRRDGSSGSGSSLGLGQDIIHLYNKKDSGKKG